VTRFSGAERRAIRAAVRNLPTRGIRKLFALSEQRPGLLAGAARWMIPRFYSYALSGARGLSHDQGKIGKRLLTRPTGAEFVRPYDACARRLETPDQAWLEFLQSTYEAAALQGDVGSRCRNAHWASEACAADRRSFSGTDTALTIVCRTSVPHLGIHRVKSILADSNAVRRPHVTWGSPTQRGQ